MEIKRINGLLRDSWGWTPWLLRVRKVIKDK